MAVVKKQEAISTGIQITTHRAAIVSIACEDDKIILKQCRAIPIAAGIVENGIITEIEVFAQSLKKVLTDWSISSKFVNVTVPALDIVAKNIETPKLKKTELYNFLTADIEEHPVMIKYKEKISNSESIDEVDEDMPSMAMAFSQIDYEEENDRTRFFLMASPIELYNSFIKAFNLIERAMVSFSTDTFGILAFLQIMKPYPDEVNMVVYVCDDYTEIMIVKGVTVYFYHKAQFNSQAIIKRPMIMADIISRLNTIMMSYQDRYPTDQAVDKIIIVSNNSDIMEIFKENVDELKEKYSKPVIILDPLKYIDMRGSDIDQEYVTREIYSFLPVIGIALAYKKDYPILDFLKNKSFIGPIFNKKDMILAAVTALAAAGVIFSFYVLLGYYGNMLDSKLESIKDKLTKATRLNQVVESNQVSEIKKELSTLENLLQVKMSRMEYLDTLTELIPDQLWINRLDIKTSPTDVTIIFSGKGASKYALDTFIRNLKEEYDTVEMDMVKITANGVEYAFKCIKRRDVQ